MRDPKKLRGIIKKIRAHLPADFKNFGLKYTRNSTLWIKYELKFRAIFDPYFLGINSMD